MSQLDALEQAREDAVSTGEMQVVNVIYAWWFHNRIMLSRSTGARRRQQRQAEASGKANRGYMRKPR